ncbi:MAG: hypothetical protein ABJD11_03450 [Gemmatimonadota bacterium]
MHTRLIFTIEASDADPSGFEIEHNRDTVEFLVTGMKYMSTHDRPPGQTDEVAQ